jgi:hypothetical protein
LTRAAATQAIAQQLRGVDVVITTSTPVHGKLTVGVGPGERRWHLGFA